MAATDVTSVSSLSSLCAGPKINRTPEKEAAIREMMHRYARRSAAVPRSSGPTEQKRLQWLSVATRSRMQEAQTCGKCCSCVFPAARSSLERSGASPCLYRWRRRHHHRSIAVPFKDESCGWRTEDNKAKMETKFSTTSLQQSSNKAQPPYSQFLPRYNK